MRTGATSRSEGVLPWSRSCFVCGEANPHGLRLRSRLEGGKVVLEHTTREADLGWKHIVHGGITMTLLDEVMTWASIVHLRGACVAAEMTVRLKKPIAAGQRIRVEGEAAGSRGRLILTSGRVLSECGEELARATGKYAPMPEGQVRLDKDDFLSGPEGIRLEDLFPDLYRTSEKAQ